jgi:hypothetical protein
LLSYLAEEVTDFLRGVVILQERCQGDDDLLMRDLTNKIGTLDTKKTNKQY